MNAKKKLLIVSMASGFGHIRAGDAMLDYAKENLPDVDAQHINFSNLSNPIAKYSNQVFYEITSKKFPWVWGWLYHTSNDHGLLFFVLEKLLKIQLLFSGKILKFFIDKNPDIIIFTNTLPANLFVSNIRKVLGNTVAMAIVVTDYHGHLSYHIPHMDYYFVASGDVSNDLERIGISKEKIIISGIPINPRFYIQENVKGLKLKYGINNDLPVIVLIASFRISKNDLVFLTKQLLDFTPHVNVILITNGNQEFYDAAKDSFLHHERLLLVNWTNVIEEYIKSSDVVISKAGGLTVSECVTLQKPLVIVNPIPGQEEYNAAFIEKNNLGVRVKNIHEIIAVLPELMLTSRAKTHAAPAPQNPCKKIFSVLLNNRSHN